MLSDWAGHYISAGGPGEGVQFHVPWRDAEQSISLLSETFTDIEWAATSEVAADRIEPYLSSLPTREAYLPRRIFTEASARLADHDDAREVEAADQLREAHIGF